MEHHDEDPGLVGPEDARMREEAVTEGALPQQQRHRLHTSGTAQLQHVIKTLSCSGGSQGLVEHPTPPQLQVVNFGPNV